MQYNGHKSWAYWNVALWIANDETLYRAAKSVLRASKTKDIAARRLKEYQPEKTPDGARYSVSAVREAIKEL